MRYVFIFSLLIPTLSFAQQKKDTKIIVTVQDTTNILNRIALALYEKGYTLDQKDEAVKFIATKEKAIAVWKMPIKVRALVKNNTIVLSGDYIPPTDNKWNEVNFRGHKKSMDMQAWDELRGIAESIGNQITYSK
jgi:hypothetical protein